jgi:hypothetical protein
MIFKVKGEAQNVLQDEMIFFSIFYSIVEQELPTLPEHLNSPRFSVGFMLLDLYVCAL